MLFVAPDATCTAEEFHHFVIKEKHKSILLTKNAIS